MSDRTIPLTKMCELHGIGLARDGTLADRFQAAFPAASFDERAGEWRMVWKKGSFAESNARLEAFFAENGVPTTQIDKC